MATASPISQSSTVESHHSQRPRYRGSRTRRTGQRGGIITEGHEADLADHPSDRGSEAVQLGGQRFVEFRPSSVVLQTPASSSNTRSTAPSNSTDIPTRGRGGLKRGRGLRGDIQENRRIHENRRQEGHDSVQERNAETSNFGQSDWHVHSPGNSVAGSAAGRAFVGRLTTKNGASSPPATVSTLQADALEFHPGQPYLPRASNTRKGRMASDAPRYINSKKPIINSESKQKSTAPDIATRTHEDILNRVYECPICTNEVDSNSKIWSCETCWTVFHLNCIKKWSANEGSTQSRQHNAEREYPLPRQWRCPGCNLPKANLPSSYSCWCKKELDPQPISGIPPHSCGQSCGKHRSLPRKCPHPCDLLCHAGPCPSCVHLGPVQSCFCGKTSTSRRCIDTNYDTGWSCGDMCNDIMLCGEHLCQEPCHEGLCGACEVRVQCRCYCGKVEKTLMCHERGEKRSSRLLKTTTNGINTMDEWIGLFECGNFCQRKFDCGRHSCQKRCHSQECSDSRCPLSPDVIVHCPCGKTLLSEIMDKPRESCEDPIPRCEKKCLKKLPCGHSCGQTCHSGQCMPCLNSIIISCQCGRVQSSTICHQGSEVQPQCFRNCKATLNCGRHECGERCCPGERKAAERQATKRKLKPLGGLRSNEDEFEAEHICTRLCGRLLKCGNHTCPELCHKGQCASCKEAIFDELSCHCGKTVLQPPLPCGTAPPPCRFECERPKSCGHPRIPHNCHGDNESCPKCPFLMKKMCMCGKKDVVNQPCWLADIRCGQICGEKLKCGSHYCRKPCHRPGECEDASKPCQQACGKSKKICGHPCEEQCHAPASCREEVPCQSRTIITCSCQHLKQELRCNACKTTEGNSKKGLGCNDECGRLERNRKLALALNIDQETHKDDHVPYSKETMSMFREQTKWAQLQERELRAFANNESEKRLRFKPMPPHQRAFLHSLSDDFGFDSESMDPEPHRHVAVFKTPKFVMAPMKTLAECNRIRPQADMSTLTEPESRVKAHSAKQPYNGFVLSLPRFGLTIDEIRTDFSSILDSNPGLIFDISFLPNEEIVLKARPSMTSFNIAPSSIDATLKAWKSPLLAVTSSKRLANSIELCALDSSLNIIRRENDDFISNGGWSQVAAKAAAPRLAPVKMAIGEKSVYTVLGSQVKDAKKKKVDSQKVKLEMNVVEDWEQEIQGEEAAEELDRRESQALSEGGILRAPVADGGDTREGEPAL